MVLPTPEQDAAAIIQKERKEDADTDINQCRNKIKWSSHPDRERVHYAAGNTISGR